MLTAFQEYFASTLFKVLILVLLTTEFLVTLYTVCIAQDVIFLLMSMTVMNFEMYTVNREYLW